MEPSKVLAKCSVVVSIDVLYVWEDVIEDVSVLGANVLVDVSMDSSGIHVDIGTDICRDISSDVGGDIVVYHGRHHRPQDDTIIVH